MTFLRLMAFSALVCVVAVGCSWSRTIGRQDTASSDPDGVNACPNAVPVVRFVSYRAEDETYRTAIDTFNAQNPDMCVVFVALPEGDVAQIDPSETGIVRNVRSGLRLGDALEIQRADLTTWTKDLFLDLAPLIAGDPSFNLADYFPHALERIDAAGNIYLLPRALYNLKVISYNTDLWQARGLSEPPANWTWQDTVQAAKQLTVATETPGTTYGFAQTGYGASILIDLDAEHGGDLHQQEATAIDFDFRRPTFVALVEHLRDLQQRGVLYLDADDEQQIHEQIRAGKIGMWWGVGLHPKNISDLPFPVGMIAYPETKRHYQNIITGFVINRATLYPDQAWRWLNFLSKQPIPSMGRWEIMDYPTRRSLVAQGGPWEQYGTEAARAMAIIAERPRVNIKLPVYGDAEPFTTMRDILKQVLLKQQSPEQAIREGQELLNQRVAQHRLTPTPSAPLAPQPVNTSVAQALPPNATPIAFGAPNLDMTRLQPLAERFHQQYPGIFVHLRALTGGSLQEYTTHADCFFAPGDLPPDSQSLLLDLRPLLDADAAFPHDDYLPGLLAAQQHDGALRGLPYEVALRTLVYRQDAFDQAKLAYPTAHWTLDDLLAAAQTLTQAQANPAQYGWATTAPLADLDFFLAAHDVALVQGSEPDAQPTFTTPAMTLALRQYVDLQRRFGPPLPSTNAPTATMEADQLIEAGQVGMWLDRGIRVSSSPLPPQRYGFSSAIAAPPFGTTAPTARDIAVLSNLVIAAHSPHSAACWQWLTVLSADPSCIQSGFPARRSVAEMPQYHAQARPGTPETYAAYRQALTRAGAWRTLLPLERAINLTWLYRAVERALQGGDLERELHTAQTVTEQHLACVRSGGGAEDCATQVDPQYNGTTP